MKLPIRIARVVARNRPALAGLVAAVALLAGGLSPMAPVALADQGDTNPLELGGGGSDTPSSNPLLRLFAPWPLLAQDDSKGGSQEGDPDSERTGQSGEAASDTSAVPQIPADAQLRVGIQAGHWKTREQPNELASLRASTGAQGKGWREADINLDIAQRVVALLAKQNVLADLLPATVPVHYKADAFVALHGDSNNPSRSGYKTARAIWSAIPNKDDALLNAINSSYGAATGLKEDKQTITQNMTMYYAFNGRRLQHAVDPSTPSVILEMGFLSNSSDRKLLTEQQDKVAQAIASGVMQFLAPR